MKKIMRQKNKNNPTKPENQLKKEYQESYEELKKSILRKQERESREESKDQIYNSQDNLDLKKKIPFHIQKQCTKMILRIRFYR